MDRRHIALFPHLGTGHVYPLLELCDLLRKRGYRISCVVDSRFARQVLEHGAEPIVIEPEVSGEDFALASQVAERFARLMGRPADPQWWEAYAEVVYPHQLVIAKNTLGQVGARFARDVPDLFIYDRLGFAGRILARRLSRPAVQVYPHFAYYRNFLHREQGVCINPEPMLGFAAVLDAFLQAEGIETSDNLWHTEDLNLYFIPQAFQHNATHFDERSCFVGACLSRTIQPLWVDRSGGKPVFLVSDLSQAPDATFFNAIVDAFEGEECHLVLSVGETFAGAQLKRLPDNFEINRHASHLEILRRAELMICHGGTGTSLEAIYNGVPVIALPPTPPTGETAFRLAELGIGMQLSREEAAPSDIRDAARNALADSALAARVRTLQRAFRGSGGAPLAADRIEQVLGVR